MSRLCHSLIAHSSRSNALDFVTLWFFELRQYLHRLLTLRRIPIATLLPFLQQDVWFTEALRGSLFGIGFLRGWHSSICKPQVQGWRALSCPVSSTQPQYAGVPRPLFDKTSIWDL